MQEWLWWAHTRRRRCREPVRRPPVAAYFHPLRSFRPIRRLGLRTLPPLILAVDHLLSAQRG